MLTFTCNRYNDWFKWPKIEENDFLVVSLFHLDSEISDIGVGQIIRPMLGFYALDSSGPHNMKSFAHTKDLLSSYDKRLQWELTCQDTGQKTVQTIPYIFSLLVLQTAHEQDKYRFIVKNLDKNWIEHLELFDMDLDKIEAVNQ